MTVVDLQKERLDRAVSVSINRHEARSVSMKAAMRFASGVRYAGEGRVIEVARLFLLFVSAASSPEDQRCRSEALSIALTHLARPRSLVSPERIVAAARTFYDFLLEDGL